VRICRANPLGSSRAFAAKSKLALTLSKKERSLFFVMKILLPKTKDQAIDKNNFRHKESTKPMI
jgi:hypothetical protein